MPPTPDPTPDAPASHPTPGDAHRLPRDVVPARYTLTLEPDLGTATFTGQVEIALEILAPTAQVVCNAADLTLEGATLTGADGAAQEAAVDLDAGAERVTFSLGAPLPAGPAVLRCRFTGVLNDKLRGFYRSTFVDQDGQTRTIATTQMESTDARRAFPCWDEPDRKAVFEVTLVVDDELAAFSNSAVAAEEHITDDRGRARRRVRFAPTMAMSTYLVAFVVGPLEATEPLDVDGVPVRVVHVPGRSALTGFALEVAAHALRFFSSYFDIPYPADKLDLVAIPDFAFGAMENLGCVTFRETALLVDPASAARTELERVADVVAHEIAHMWFGDLVTMSWWEGIWLNEAFATFMEVLCVDAFRPQWQRWVSFGLEREAALAVDGLHTTRPIEFPVGSPEEADAMFDVLTYQKGGSVLRMLERYLGADTFRDGVRRYLRTHAYANTVTADLWDALETVSGEPVRAVMDSWILQGGHPIVALEQGALHQSPFAYAPPAAGRESAIGHTWQVPVLLRTLGDPAGPAGTRRVLLGADPVSPADQDGGPVVLNAGGWGVYRTGYQADHLARLAPRLGDLDPLERFNLLADTWALVLAGRAELDAFFTLARHLGPHDGGDPAAWSVVAGALSLCDRVVPATDRPAVEAAARTLLGERAAALGWDPVPGEGERVPTLRALLIATLGTVGADGAVRDEAARRFDSAAGGGPAVGADIETAVLQALAAARRPGDYETFLERYRHPATPQEEQRYLMALAAFPDAALTVRTFELARTEVRSQNAPYLVAALMANREGGPAVWERVAACWEELLERFPVNSHSRMLDGARSLCRDPGTAREVTAFLEAHPLRSGQRSVSQMLERLAVNVAFGERWRDRLGEVLGGVAGAGPGA